MRSATGWSRTNPWAVPLVTLCACATVDPSADYQAARDGIRASTGEEVVYDPEEPPLRSEEIEAVLSGGLRLEEATRLALLNNRRLHAGFLSLGVARADYVQAGLLENPSLSLAFLFPDGGGRVKWAAELAGNVSEIWQIPSREAVARAGLEQRILELSRFAGELVIATKTAYFESVAAREARSVARTNAELAKRSLDAVHRRVENGVATRIEENLAQSLVSNTELESQRAEREEAAGKRRLAALLSLKTDLFVVELTDPIPEPSSSQMDREALVAQSLRGRADVRAASAALEAAEGQAALERRQKFPSIGAGIAAERPEVGSSVDFLSGPGATIEIPIFDQNQAQVSRADFRVRELRKEQEALEAEAGQAVRAAVDEAVIAARAAVFARDELLPQAEESAVLAQRSYELGDTTVLVLLEAQRGALRARTTGIATRLEAARSRLEVERALGAPIDSPAGEEWVDEQ